MVEITNTIWIMLLIIILLYFLHSNVIVGIFIILIILYLYKYQNKYIKEFKKIIEPVKTDNNNNHYNENINILLDKIKKYKKYNLNEYNTGIKYYHIFMNNIHKLENRNLKHSKQYLDNAKYFLTKSINHLQFITNNISDKNLIHGIKYEDFTEQKKLKKLHKLIDDLYQLSFKILFTLSNDKEQEFLNDPNIYSGHVSFVEPEPSNNINLHELY